MSCFRKCLLKFSIKKALQEGLFYLGLKRVMSQDLYIEQEVQDIAIFYNILFPFSAHLASLLAPASPLN